VKPWCRSTLTAKGKPGVVERTLIRPPASRMGPAKAAERQKIIAASPLGKRYDTSVDRKSAYELLTARAKKAGMKAEQASRKTAGKPARKASTGRKRQSVWEAMVKSVARSLGSSVGRQIARGILGSLLKR